MRHAIALSARGLGTTSPNPPVGCVVLDSAGTVVGTGYHRRKGESHAEAYALAAAGDRAHGGTAVVTLEPCNHVGRTPACRQLLLDAGISRVVIAVIDPTSRGDGGAAVLRSAGVDVEVGVLAEEAREVLGPWLGALASGRPTVTASYVLPADSVDLYRGAILEQRVTVDAVVLEDGRVEEGFKDSHGVGVLDLPGSLLQLAPADALKRLYTGGVRSVLVAGGVHLAAEYLDAGLVERVTVYTPVEERISPSTDELSGLALPGFRITNIAKRPTHVRMDALRVTEADAQ